uniref:Anaphase-promoting complex subunit 4 n=1 Tax=Hyaloperonospora arabidopsidis (strain Emoy2) TaxID=559515 RepID=M4B4N6_HYAAE
MVTLAWRPDGLQLAVGCDAGDVVLIDVESGDILSRGCSSFRHDNCITAIHWTQITETMDQNGRYGERKQRCWKRSGGAGDAGASSSRDVVSQSKLQFQRRATKFFAGPCDPTCPDTLLVTADRGGCIALWWMGRVLLTRIDVRDHFTEKEFQLLDRAGQGESGKAGFHVERVSAAPDLTLVLVLLAFCNRTSGQVDGVANDSKSYRMLSLDTTTIQHICEDVALVASTVSRVHTLLDRVVSYGNQMKTEWKNATRIFELKMGLIGSLYEKYACEVSPQEDMLSVLVSGITPPVLAQYFAQDIQEMSVHRMQKALYSGCDSLRTLAEGKLKQDLVELLFLLSEMRGHAKWNPQNYATTLGITMCALDNLVQTIEDVLVEVEALILAIHETLHDLALFFQWVMERIRIHTNVHRQEGESPAAGIGACNASAANGINSLLNLRHLCDFLQRAADAAKRYRKQQPSQNRYKVETTFGNLVSCHLSARQDSSEDTARQPAARCFDISCQYIQDQWIALQNAMSVTLARTIRRDEGGCFTVGNTNNAVDECHIHFRNPFSERISDEIVESADESDEEESDEETIDWDSLKYYGRLPNDKADCSTILVGFRLQSGLVLLLRASQRVDCRPLEHETPSLLSSAFHKSLLRMLLYAEDLIFTVMGRQTNKNSLHLCWTTQLAVIKGTKVVRVMNQQGQTC